MAKSELNNIKTYIETLNDPSITFISAQPMPTTQQTYDSYNNLNKTPSNYMTPRKKT